MLNYIQILFNFADISQLYTVLHICYGIQKRFVTNDVLCNRF